MKKIIISIIVFALVLLLLLVLNNRQSNDDAKSLEVVYSDLDITFKLPSDSNIVTSNFLKDSSVTPDKNNPGLYELGNLIEGSETVPSPAYAIIFDKESGVFTVSLLKKPFAQSRFAAELYLKNLLRLSEADMCKLSYVVAVPGYIDHSASGNDYRFSFCPGSVQL